jgi:hypothetical protein
VLAPAGVDESRGSFQWGTGASKLIGIQPASVSALVCLQSSMVSHETHMFRGTSGATEPTFDPIHDPSDDPQFPFH